MKTDELINVLTHANPPVPSVSLTGVVMLMAIALCAITGLFLGYRPDLMGVDTALPMPFVLKTAFFFTFLSIACVGLRRESVPVGGGRLATILFTGLIVVLLSAVAVEVVTKSLSSILSGLGVLSVRTCLLVVTAYSAAGAVLIVSVLRLFAPADTEKAALWAGLTAASAGALGYSLHCQSDSPSFILLAYGAPCLLVSSLTGLIAPRFLKW